MSDDAKLYDTVQEIDELAARMGAMGGMVQVSAMELEAMIRMADIGAACVVSVSGGKCRIGDAISRAFGRGRDKQEALDAALDGAVLYLRLMQTQIQARLLTLREHGGGAE